MDKQSRIFVAGHKGLLGTRLVARLSAAGHTNILTRDRQALDLADHSAVDKFFAEEKPAVVFLAAGLTGGIMANKTYPADYFHINIAIQDSVFEAAIKHQAERIVFYGSSCMYPREAAQPMKEEALLTGKIEETSEAYAAAKIAGIIACRAYNNQHGPRRFIALVPNSMFGPGDNFDPQRSHVFSSLIKKFHEAKLAGERTVTLWGSGRPRREFVFVDDVVAASLFAVDQAGRLENHHYNVGAGRDHSIRELAEAVAGVVGYDGRIEWDETKPDGAPRKLLDSGKFLALGWRPATELADGLKQTYAWFKANHGQARN